MRERVGVLLSVIEDLGCRALDHEGFGIALLALVWLLLGVLLGVQVIR